MLGKLVHHPIHHRWAQDVVAVKDGPDGADQFLVRGVLEQIAVRPGLQGAGHVLVVVEGREHQDLGRGALAAQAPDDRKTVIPPVLEVLRGEREG